MDPRHNYPTIVLSPSPSPGRAFRPLPSPPRPTPPTLEVDVTMINELIPTERLPNKPKRATYILRWATEVQPGSPAVPSPLSDHAVASPLLSASTETLARQLIQFSGLPTAQTPVHLTRIVTATPTSSRLSPLHHQHQHTNHKAPLADARSPSVASPQSGIRSITISVGHSSRRLSNRRDVARRPSRRTPARAGSRRWDARNQRNSRVLLAVAEAGLDDARLRHLTARLSRQMSVAAARQSRQLGPNAAPGTNREVFLDDEEWEFAPLVVLDDESAEYDDGWVDFDAAPPALPVHPASASSRYSHESDLVSEFALPNPYDVRSPAQATPPYSGNGLSSSDASTKTTPGLSILAIPARSQRKAAHLRKPSYVTELEAFALPKSPLSPSVGMPRSAAQPPPPVLPTPKGAARRRPTPLDIPTPPTPSRFSGVSPLDAQLVRMAFVAQSFAPPTRAADVGAVPEHPPTPMEDEIVTRQAGSHTRSGSGGSGGGVYRHRRLGSGVMGVLSAVSSSIRTGSSNGGGGGGHGNKSRNNSVQRREQWI